MLKLIYMRDFPYVVREASREGSKSVYVGSLRQCPFGGCLKVLSRVDGKNLEGNVVWEGQW